MTLRIRFRVTPVFRGSKVAFPQGTLSDQTQGIEGRRGQGEDQRVDLHFMAFLQRVVNGGGRIEREYAVGRGCIDIAVWFGGAWSIIEIKLVRNRGREVTILEGLKQIARYRDHIDPSAPAFLVVFDRTPAGRAKTWEERFTREEREASGGKVTVISG